MRTLLLSLFVLLVSCQGDPFDHDGVLDNGFKYKILKSVGGTPLQVNQVASIELKIVDDQNKVLSNSRNQKMKPSIHYPNSNLEVVAKNPVFGAAKIMGIGDRVVVRVPVKKLENAPVTFKHSKYVDYHVDVINIQSFDEHTASQMATVQHLDGPKITEAREILDLYKGNYLKGKKRILDSGVIIKFYNGENGTKYAESGDRVLVNYVGFLGSREVFDDSYKRNKPYRFILDQDPMITGWLEALKNIPEGASAVVEIPPDQAYGDLVADGIPPQSTLIFVLTMQGVENL